MQALILAGGEGTRLRPLTSTIPKPVVPLANQPFIAFMIEWLKSHGVDDVILSCGFLAEGVRRVLHDGEGLGVRLRYVDEPEPLGTGGALRFAGDLLDERFFMLNGDVLTDMDLTAQLEQHERTGARATLALIGVEDPSAYGLVRLAAGNWVDEFVEKPGAEEIDSNLINAGAYILERSVLDTMPPPGTNISIERDVFPRLVGNGLAGFPSQGYWLDIGTPDRYLQGTFDILEGRIQTPLAQALARPDGTLVGDGVMLADSAVIGPRAALGPGVSVAEGAHIESSAVLSEARVGAASTVRSSIISPGVVIGEHCHIEGSVLGEGVRLGPGNTLGPGTRLSG